MAEIYDFTKYLSEKEIEMYESSKEEKLCIACPECSSQSFTIFLDNTIECIACDLSINLEFSE